MKLSQLLANMEMELASRDTLHPGGRRRRSVRRGSQLISGPLDSHEHLSRMPLVKSKYRGSPLYYHVHAELVRAAQYRGVTTYQDLAIIMALPLVGAHMGAETGHILGEIVEDEVLAGRPMLSAVAVGVSGRPGPGFFTLARDLERLHGADDETAFWQAERDRVYEAWRRPLPSRE